MMDPQTLSLILQLRFWPMLIESSLCDPQRHMYLIFDSLRDHDTVSVESWLLDLLHFLSDIDRPLSFIENTTGALPRPWDLLS